MKKLLYILIFTLLYPMLLTGHTSAASAQKRLDVLFLHDTHAHLEPFSTLEDGKSTTLGGFSRIKTLILEQKKKNPDTLLLDAGDFSMGTLVQALYAKSAPELRMLGALETDVTTLGNHEFDYLSDGLASMLSAALQSGDPLPKIALCNVDWNTMEVQGLSQEQKLLRTSFDEYGIKDYFILTKGDLRIAVTGVFGKDSLTCAPTCTLLFQDPIQALQNTVKTIKETEQADMIICLSHSGTWEDSSKFDQTNLSEDELLAQSVPEIDLIISGHSHTILEKPLLIGNTAIVSCGEYGKNLGSLSMCQTKQQRWEIQDYRLLPVTEDLPKDDKTEEKIQSFIKSIDASYLSSFGYTSQQVLAENDVTFSTVKDLCTLHQEQNLGNIIADAYVYTVNQISSADEPPVDVAIAPSGTIRDTYVKGNITVSHVFQSFSLGIGEDQIPGYPLISAYLTGRELKTMAEIDASLSDSMNTARLYMSGLSMSYNPNRLILDKVTDCYLLDTDGKRIELQDEKLYRVVTDLYTCQMLGSVTDLSYGLLAIVPKDVNGNTVTNINDLIVTENGREQKAWDAIARYMLSFSDTDGNGIGNVPAKYDSSQGRKIIEDSKKLTDRLKNPGPYAKLFGLILLLVFLLLSLIITFTVKRIRKKHSKKGKQKRSPKHD